MADATEEKGVAIEVLGTCETNTTPDSQHTAKVEYHHLWSYAQQAALIAVSENNGPDGCYRLITDPERRAKRIAGHYAELYFKSAEKSANKIQFRWPALAAFVVKDIGSSYLDDKGNVKGRCPLDPEFHIPMEDWLKLMPMTQRYEWMGDGVLAALIVRCADDSRGLTYTIDLEFQDFAIHSRRNAADEARGLAEGDKKGWGSSEEHKKWIEKNRADVKILEENAARRGDRLLPRT